MEERCGGGREGGGGGVMEGEGGRMRKRRSIETDLLTSAAACLVTYTKT